MRYLLAPPAPGRRPDDFAWTMPGEVLTLPPVCDRRGCPCGRVFIGVSSLRPTTTGVVLDLALDEHGVAQLARQAVARALSLPLAAIEHAEAIEAVRLITGALLDRAPGDVVRVTDLNMEAVR